ncbi:hypothetical protein [Salisediminibacterium beveridgei]|uniref:Uncharacterized protein n=1 Tax=Salisediminibacterium beveridgei TaxID=632773 RepID=A0A1D7QR58_9BACI|nr:hypothetical protein [Salisediminibacterium beveridgei]AOM81476.1 hypothetical protein BBEV_0081 [Salisediminibacterium beveridgei]
MMMEVYQDLWQVLMIAGLIMSVTSAHAGILFLRHGHRKDMQLMQHRAAGCHTKPQLLIGSGATLDTWQTRLVSMIQRKIAPDDDDEAHHSSFFHSQSEMKKGAGKYGTCHQPIHPTNQ